MLRGLSCRADAECAEAVPAAFGLSPSTISRRFIRASARQLRVLCERRLDAYDVVALFLDGKTFAADELVIALGITLTGEKVLLGFVQTGTENERVCAAFLRALLERGLRAEQGLLSSTARRVCGRRSRRSSARRRWCSAVSVGGDDNRDTGFLALDLTSPSSNPVQGGLERPKNPGRVPDHDRPRGHIAHHNTPRPDDGSLSNRYPTEDRRA